MNQPRQPAALRLTPPALRTALLFAASLIWLIFGGYLFAETRSVLPAILALLGLVSTVIYGLALIPGGSYLEAGQDGLTIGASFRKRSLAWADVEEFSVRQLGRKKKLVRYRLTPRTGETSGREELLPDTYGLEAEELAKQLNDMRRFYTTGDQPPASRA